MKLRYSLLLILPLFIYSTLLSQSKSNFEIIDSLISISVSDVIKNIDYKKDYNFEFLGAEDYKILKTTIIRQLINNNINIVENTNSNKKISYNLEQAEIKYLETFKDGLFGSYLVRRKADLTGSFFIYYDGKIEAAKSFNYTLEDSVFYSDVSQLENIAYTFTTAQLPEEPFFSSTLEPVIAIGTAAVAVYLFFNIRSR